jgi:hypothetical protein
MISHLANQLNCQHCFETHSATRWPVRGDYTPLYFQEEPGNYSLKVNCPHCHRDWYVVWDTDPGQIVDL